MKRNSWTALVASILFAAIMAALLNEPGIAMTLLGIGWVLVVVWASTTKNFQMPPLDMQGTTFSFPHDYTTCAVCRMQKDDLEAERDFEAEAEGHPT